MPFEAHIRELYFREHLIGSRILRELRKAGYTGSASALYGYLKSLRAVVPSPKATMRFETAPGQQGQFDWSPYTVELGGERVKVIVYGLTLGYSRRKHYTASLDETQVSIFEAVELCLRHFGGAPKELLVDNAKAFVLDANPAHFRWNPQFLELCGHYRVKPRACQPYRAQTKGKVERPFFYLEQQFLKGRQFPSFAHFLQELAAFEQDDLDMRVHSTTQERPIDRFAAEAPHLTPLPEAAVRRHAGAESEGELGLSGQLPRQPLLGARGVRRPAGVAAGLPRHAPAGAGCPAGGDRRARPQPHQGHDGHPGRHYAALRRGPARTYVVLAEQFLARFPQHAAFLEGLVAQHKLNPAAHLRGVLELALLYDAARLEAAFAVAQEYNTYSHTFVRGVLESGGPPTASPAPTAALPPTARALPTAPVRCDLGRYQRLLEAAR